MKSTPVVAVSALLALSGCGLGDLFGGSSEDMHVRALVRDELDQAEAIRGPRRRQYIDEMISETIAAGDSGDARLKAVEAQLGELQTDISIVSRKVEKRIDIGQPRQETASEPQDAPQIDMEQLAALRADIDAALRAVSKLNADQEAAGARDNARFERLELRTRGIDWPADTGARGLHLASYRTHDAALAGWEVFRTQFPNLMAGQDPLLVEVQTVAGPFVRLVVGVAEGQDWLTRARDRVRETGEYAMIMPVPSNQAPAPSGQFKLKVPAGPKILVPGS